MTIAVIVLIMMVGTVGVVHSADAPAVKGIILLIGDGMGINQARAAAIYSRQVLGKPLTMDSIATRGTTTTYSADSEVTDSAAAATALNSGHKTNNGVINLLPDKTTRVFTIGQAAKRAGLSVGILSTARLTHATPAGVYSHVKHRDEEDSIAEQLTEFLPDVAMAGGLSHFIPQDKKGSKRKDAKNLVEVMKQKGYSYVTNDSELKAVDPAATGKLFGLFAMSHMAYELDRQHVPKLGSQPDVAEMTKVALSILGRNPKGFFLMVEGGRIDHACHAHDIKASIYDTLAFDKAVGIALEYQKKHPDVLVVVTADHETGGLGLGRGTEYALDVAALKPIKYSLEYLNQQFRIQPAELEETLKAGGYELTDSERARLSKYPPETEAGALAELGGAGKKLDEYVLSWIHYALSAIESERAKIGWTSFVHTAQPVITSAIGPGAEEFSGAYDNTDIAKKMATLLRVSLAPPASQAETTR